MVWLTVGQSDCKQLGLMALEWFFSDSTQEAWQIFLEFQIVDLLKPICWCMEMEMETCDNLTVPGFFLADDVGGGGNDDDAP